MANIATLTIALSANSAKLQSEFRKANRRAKTFGDRMRGTLRVVGRAFATMSVAAGGALASIAAAGIRTGDQLEKTAEKLGVTSEALSGLRFAAQQTGVQTRQLDLGLQRMTRRVAEAANGTGEAKAAIAELGLSAKELVNLSPDQQFLKIADAFEQVDNQSERVRLGFKLFDSEGVALVNTLGRGREELEGLFNEAQKFGLGLDSIQSRNVQEAADAFGRARSAAEGFRLQLGAALATSITTAANALAGFIATLTRGVPRLQAWVDELFNIRRELNELSLSQIQARQAILFDELRNLRQQLANPGAKGNLPEDGLLERIAEVRSELDRLAERYKQLTIEAQKPIASGVEALGAGVSKAFAELARERRLRGVLEDFAEANRLLDETIAKERELEAAGGRIFAQTRTPIENFIIQMEEARDLLAGGFITQDTFDRFREQLLDGVVAPLDEIRSAGENAFNRMSEFGVQAARNIQSQFAEFLFDPFRDGLDGMLKNFADTLRRMASEIAASQLLQSFFGLFENNKGFLGNVARGFLQGRATGGPVNALQPYLVGEQGPELFVPGRSGAIVPNGAIGGSQVEVNVINAPAKTETKRRSVGGRTIVDVILPPMMQDLAENGPLSRAIGARFGLAPAVGGR